MKVMQAHDRVGVFHSVEVQEEVLEGEWVRVTEKSTKPLDEIINQFLVRTKSTVISASAPNIVLLNTSEDKKQRTYRCSASIVYRPLEVVQNEQATGPQEEGINLEGVPATHRSRVLDAIQNGKPDAQEKGLDGFAELIQKFSKKREKTHGVYEQPAVLPADKRSANGNSKSRRVSKPSRARNKTKKSSRD